MCFKDITLQISTECIHVVLIDMLTVHVTLTVISSVSLLLCRPGVQGVSTSSTGAPLSTAVKSSLFSHLLGSGLVPGLTTVPVRGSARVMYKPNAVKRKRKHGFAKRCSSRRGPHCDVAQISQESTSTQRLTMVTERIRQTFV